MFWPKSRAIGLQFLTKIVHFQLSSFSGTNERAFKNTIFWPKSRAIGLLFLPKTRAIGLLFLPKIVRFQLSSVCSAN